MEKIEGISLQKLDEALFKNKKTYEEVMMIWKICKQGISALARLWEKDVNHRDLHSGNIMLDLTKNPNFEKIIKNVG